MNFSTRPSLKERALVKFSLILFNSPEFRKVYRKLRHDKIKRPFRIAKSAFLENHRYIPKHTPLNDDLNRCLAAINMQVVEFSGECGVEFQDVSKFCWRPNGKLHVSQTIESLSKNPEMKEIFDILAYAGVLPVD